MLTRLEDVLIHQCNLVGNQPIVVGVSGGPDSLCLLDILHRFRYQVICAHLNHSLRPESEKEADQVARIADQRGIKFIRETVDVTEFAKKKSLSIEEAARELRYDFLFTLANKEMAQAVAVGHNADDQVETVLMHMLRGSGLAGLRGMSYCSLPNVWSDRIPLIRPLLGIWRSEVLIYCQDRSIIPIIDRSNLDQTYFRNRLRHDLIPKLADYNPRIKEIIVRMADILSEDYEIINNVIKEAWEECLFEKGDSYLGLRIDRLLEKPLGVQRYLIRNAIAYHRPGLRDIDFDTIERAIHFIVQPSETMQRDLISRLMLSIEGNILFIFERDLAIPASGFPVVNENIQLDLHKSGTLTIGNGWEFTVDILELTDEIKERAFNNPNPFEAWLDKHKLEFPLQVRSRLPGDRFQPLGMAGKSIKISDFMINEKLPRRARTKWPLIVSQGKIVWVPGCRIDHKYRIKHDTKSIVLLKLGFRGHAEDNLE